jgi:hypothetical protein
MTYSEMIIRIVKRQSQIVGPLAVRIAGKVSGVVVEAGEIKVQQENPSVVDELVAEYAQLFGKASVEVCRQAVRDDLDDVPSDGIPESLR